MAKCTEEMKTFNMRMPKDMWFFLKQHALMNDESMTDIMIRCVEKFRKRVESKANPLDKNS